MADPVYLHMVLISRDHHQIWLANPKPSPSSSHENKWFRLYFFTIVFSSIWSIHQTSQCQSISCCWINQLPFDIFTQSYTCLTFSLNPTHIWRFHKTPHIWHFHKTPHIWRFLKILHIVLYLQPPMTRNLDDNNTGTCPCCACLSTPAIDKMDTVYRKIPI